MLFAKLSKLVHACRNYNLPNLAHFNWDTVYRSACVSLVECSIWRNQTRVSDSPDLMKANHNQDYFNHFLTLRFAICVWQWSKCCETCCRNNQGLLLRAVTQLASDLGTVQPERTQGCYSGLLLTAEEPRAVTQGCYSLQKNPGLLLRAVTQGCYSASDLGTVPPDWLRCTLNRKEWFCWHCIANWLLVLDAAGIVIDVLSAWDCEMSSSWPGLTVDSWL